jgi:hypothetical protein
VEATSQEIALNPQPSTSLAPSTLNHLSTLNLWPPLNPQLLASTSRASKGLLIPRPGRFITCV